MLEPQYLIIGLLGAIVFLLSQQVKQVQEKEEESDEKPQLIMRHSPFEYSHLNYYPFYNPMGSFRRHHRFHGGIIRRH